MAKIDKRQYTKEQWKVIREQRRQSKELARLAKWQPKPTPIETEIIAQITLLSDSALRSSLAAVKVKVNLLFSASKELTLSLQLF